MDKKEATFNEEVISEFSTMAILDEATRILDSEVTIPTPRGVTEAKEWVEENKK